MSNEIMTISGVSCYEKDGTAYLSLEAVARGLGFTRTAASGNEVVMWSRVDGYLRDLGVHTSVHDGYIPENIFYRLAMKAKNETAERFQALVADEIIPSIRKTGGYISGQETMSDSELMAKALLVAQRQIDERNKQIAAMEPKALFADAVSASDDCILIREMAKVLCQNGCSIGEKRLYERLRNDGYLIKTGSDRNMPTQRAIEMGLFRIKESVHTTPTGSFTTRTTKVTGKGQSYFVNKYLDKIPTSGQTAAE